MWEVGYKLYVKTASVKVFLQYFRICLSFMPLKLSIHMIQRMLRIVHLIDLILIEKDTLLRKIGVTETYIFSHYKAVEIVYYLNVILLEKL